MEDNPTDVFVIREVIEASGLGLSLQVAGNGQEALRYLREAARNQELSPLVLILLDLNIPRISGLEVLRQLRQELPFSRLPVIVVTSSVAEEDRAAVRRLGAEGYFHKPPDLAAYMQLAPLIKQVLAG